MSASRTYGGALSIYDSTYKAIGGLITCTFPQMEADAPIDATAHDSASGVREFVPAGTKKWPNLTWQCNDLPADAGQVSVAANLGASMKFRFVSTSGVTAYINAIITKWARDPQPIDGKATISGEAVPTGVAPIS
jgi:hypothetical protein